MEKIKIEVVIPVFNSERFIREGVESVLNQSGDFLEKIWLINDGSEDKTGEILEQLQQTHSLIRVIHQENKGVSAALNRGISEVTGDWIAFMDADDLWLPGKLAAQIEILEREPDLQVMFVDLEEFMDFQSDDHQLYELKIPVGEWLSRTTFLCRKSLFDQFGFFDEQLKVGEFIDWFQRVRNSGIKHHYIPQVLAKRRIHGGNLTLKVNKQDYLSLIRKQLAARKKEGKG